MSKSATSEQIRSHWLVLARFVECQWLNLLRTPGYTLPTLMFPIMFYSFFGLLMIRGQAQYLLCTFATFGCIGAALFAFGVGIATERAQGWLTLLQATPAPIAAVLVGKGFGAALFAAIITLIMSVLAAVFGDVRMATGQWAGLLLVMVLGSLPFSALGIGLGMSLAPNAAPAVLNLIYLPLGFLSGLWIPISQLPGWLQDAAVWLPPYHLAELALHVTGTRSGSVLVSLAILTGYTLLFVLFAAWAWRRPKTSMNQ